MTWNLGSHIAVYQINPSTQTVEVHAVRHGASYADISKALLMVMRLVPNGTLQNLQSISIE